MIKLCLCGQDSARTVIQLNELPAVLGRSLEADLTLDDRWASRLHCRLELTGDRQVRVRDLNSKHGTFVNQRRINEAVLRPGDVLCIGLTSLQVEYSPQQLTTTPSR